MPLNTRELCLKQTKDETAFIVIDFVSLSQAGWNKTQRKNSVRLTSYQSVKPCPQGQYFLSILYRNSERAKFSKLFNDLIDTNFFIACNE